MIESRDTFMKNARTRVMNQVPHWANKLEEIITGLPLSNPKLASETAMKQVVTKVFNAKGNSVMKRYFSMYLARGGKKASQSTSRELRKQEGLGKKALKQETK